MSGLPNLHCHLDGSLRPETLAELAAARGRPVPSPLAFSVGMGLSAALARFAFTLSCLDRPEDVERVASEMCEDAVRDGVTTLEIRFAPQLHGAVPEFVAAARSGIAGRAALVVCGLYGQHPDVLMELAEQDADGLDLAGAPAPQHPFGMADYAPAFTRARDRGLGRTVHASEGRPADEIRVAIEQLHAQRIGHGTTLLDDPSIVELVVERGVTIEACPTSNCHVGAIPSVAEHPLPRWLELGVRACINPDNTLLSAVSASQEHARVSNLRGMTPERMAQAVAYGHAAAFPIRG